MTNTTHGKVFTGQRLLGTFLLLLLFVVLTTLYHFGSVPLIANLVVPSSRIRNISNHITPRVYDKLQTVSERNDVQTGHSMSSGHTQKPVEYSTRTTHAFSIPHYMTIGGNGRLGNKMFQFATLLGISRKHGYTPFIIQRHMLNNVFDIPQMVPSLNVQNMQSVGEGAAGIYFEKLETLSHDKNYTLVGYYQCWKYFDFVSDLVRKSFKFKANLAAKAKIALDTYREGSRPFVGVHVRRSDMSSSRELRRGYNVATKSFFDKAFDFFRKNLTKPVFIVVSDDLRWCKATLQAADVRFVSTGSPGGDLNILASCNHSVVSTGTFGWWGGYLTGGTVVYFTNYPARNSWLESQYRRTDYYPPYWIGME